PLLPREVVDEFVIVQHLTGGLLFGRERDLVVGIEIAAERRHPIEVPAHPALESLDLGERRPRHDDEGDITLRQMECRFVEMIGKVRGAWAAGFPAWTKHKMIDDQLAFAVEQIGKRSFAGWRVEDVVLVHFLPWQFATLAGERVASTRECLLFR